MTSFNTVLVGVDGSDGATRAVRWAANHARDTAAALRLVHAVTSPGTVPVVLPVPAGGSSAALQGSGPAADDILAAAAEAATAQAPGVAVRTESLSGLADEVLVDESATADVVVVGSSGRGRVTAAITGSVAVRVAGQARCPSVVVRAPGHRDGPVVVGVDGSEAAEPALRFAFTHASRRRTTIIAVHARLATAVPVSVSRATAHAVVQGHAEHTFEDVEGRLLTDTLRPWREEFPDVRVQERMELGGAVTALLANAANAAMVVVGSRGRGPIEGLLLGSTDQSLLQYAPCPVVVAPAADANQNG